MNETLLITRSDFDGIVNLSDHHALGDDLLNQYIKERQFLDLTGLLGSNFLEDILDNLAESSYAPILDGATWEYSGKKYRHYGLRRVLVHYSFAAYVYRGGMVDTPYSFVQKRSQNSLPVPITDLRALHNEHRRIAHEYWVKTHLYLCHHKDDFAEFEDCDCTYCDACGDPSCGGCDRKAHNTRGIRTKVLRGKL